VLPFLTQACVWPSPERQFLLDFFHACRVYDTTVLARMATTSCNPASLGVIDAFDVIRVVNDGVTRKEVTIDAALHSLAGQRAQKMFLVVLEDTNGRWMVTSLTPPPASQTSPAASSAPPK
jgi:hypothetical protein